MRRLITTASAVLLAASASASAHAADACPNAAYRHGAAASLPDCRAYEQVSPVDKDGVNVKGLSGVQSTEDRTTFLTGNALPQADGAPYDSRYLATRGDGAWTTRAIDPPARANEVGGVLLLTTTIAVSDDDLSAIVTSKRALAPGAIEGTDNLYLRDLRDGSFRLLPDAASAGRLAGTPDDRRVAYVGGDGVFVWRAGAVSDESALPDGRRATVFGPLVAFSRDGRRLTTFLGDDQATGLYSRVVGGETVLIARSERDGASPSAPVFVSPDDVRAVADGSQVVFGSFQPLTDDVPADATGRLYRWSADGDRLEDLLAGITPIANLDARLDYVSPDGRYVWFFSPHELSAGATENDSNLFALDTRTLRLSFAGNVDPYFLARSYSPSGNAMAFDGGDTVRTVNVADASPRFVCVSCGSGPTPAAGPASINRDYGGPRAVTDDGRVFFDTVDRLVPDDVNTLADVYEYTPGHGVALISSGAGDTPVRFAQISPSGEDVFLFTDAQLVGQDEDDLVDLYDARAGGGLASQQARPAAASCSGDGCRDTTPATPARPVAGAPAPGRAAPPSFTVGMPTSAARRTAARTGRLAVKVRTSTAGRITLRARARVGGKTRTVAAGSRTAKRAQTSTLTLRLSARARRQLRRAGSLKMTVTATFSRVSGSTSLRLTLKRASAPKRKGGSR